MQPLLIPKHKDRTETTLQLHIKCLKICNDYKVLLLGDSIFERMNEYSQYQQLAKMKYIFNAGVGGDGIEHILYRLDKNFLSYFGRNLKKIVILAGTNNIEKYDEHKIYEGFSNLLGVIRKRLNMVVPVSLQMILIGLPPRFSSTQEISNEIIMQRVQRYNRLISTLPDIFSIPDSQNKYQMEIPINSAAIHRIPLTTKCQYYDFSPHFMDIEGNINNDMFIDHVHFSDLGYKIFIDKLSRII